MRRLAIAITITILASCEASQESVEPGYQKVILGETLEYGDDAGVPQRFDYLWTTGCGWTERYPGVYQSGDRIKIRCDTSWLFDNDTLVPYLSITSCQ